MTDANDTQDIVTRAETLLAGVNLGNQDSLTYAAWWAAENETENYGSHPNVRFVDAAPTLVRELVDEVRRLRGALTEIADNADKQSADMSEDYYGAWFSDYVSDVATAIRAALSGATSDESEDAK